MELRDADHDTVGTVIAVFQPDHVRVEWNTGPGYRGKTMWVATRALRPWRDPK